MPNQSFFCLVILFYFIFKKLWFSSQSKKNSIYHSFFAKNSPFNKLKKNQRKKTKHNASMQKHGWTNLECWMPTNQSTILTNFPIISLCRFRNFFPLFLLSHFWYLTYCNLLLFAYDPSMKEGCLFVLFVTLRLFETMMLFITPFLPLEGKPSMR